MCGMFSVYIISYSISCITFLFFFNDTATTEIYTLSLHDALPICQVPQLEAVAVIRQPVGVPMHLVNHPIASIERSEVHTSELQSHSDLVCRLLLEKKKNTETGLI